MVDTTGLDTNFRFLVLKVTKQIELIHRVLERPESGVFQRMKASDDYIDHLKSIIENKCFSLLQRYGNLDKAKVDSLRSMNVITANLEHIADYAVSVARQASYFTDPSFFRRYDYQPFFDQILEALGLVLEAFEQCNAQKALQICRSEIELDRLYKSKFERILTEMQASGEVPDLVTSLFIFHYLERMGDSLLNVGEAILFYRLGEKLKLNQYQYLRETIAAVRGEEAEVPERVGFEGIWGTRSGCRIGKVSEISSEFADDQDVIYKEGAVQKIRNEKEGIERLAGVFPGLPPRVVEYQEGDQDAAILMEYLEGENLQQMVLDADPDLLRGAVRQVQRTVRTIWEETKQVEPVKPRFLGQLASRLEDVYTIHPQRQGSHKQIGGLAIPSFEELLRRNLHIDEVLTAPFSVLGHGDFNLDNIIYNPDERRVHFLDLHRLRQMDYVQDVSVFLVSSFRLPVFDRSRRSRINSVIASYYRFAASFARRHEDLSFDARLAVGLIRSLVTSMRFEFNRSFADEMMDRAVYLLVQLEKHDDHWESFALPDEILFY